ncbi:hypothetical protein [Nonomuraea jabiensis]|uniref:hypothetical protein n=1 Tax=Nonomuraea jabiensis TaxID=882448 RepID=UPI003D720CA4
MGLWKHPVVPDRQYVQKIRSFPPSALLPLVAEAGTRAVLEPTGPQGPLGRWQEWILADIARVSLAQGNEHRSAAPAMSDLWNIHGMFHLHGNRRPEEVPLEVHLLQLFNQQLEGQADGYQAQARSAAILLDTSTDKPLEVIGKPGWEHDLFGCSLVQYVAATRLIRASALTYAGRVDPGVLTGPEADKLLKHIDQATFDAVLARHFAIDAASFKEAERPWREKADAELRRFTYNPLRESPLISGYGSGYLCPSPHLAWSKSTPLGLYFTGRKHYGDMSFAQDMGHLFEAYIGRHLRLLPHAQVHAEIIHRYGRKGSQQLNSVDWIVEFPDLLLLVEVKATMPTEAVRLGDLDAAQAAWKKLIKACDQIDAVAGYLRDGHEAYAHIRPAGRPILGLVITLEPFYLINAYDFLPARTTPVYVASAEELERLVTVTSTTASQLLLEHHAERAEGWHVRESFAGHTFERNPIVESAWQRYPWSGASTDPDQSCVADATVISA